MSVQGYGGHGVKRCPEAAGRTNLAEVILRECRTLDVRRTNLAGEPSCLGLFDEMTSLRPETIRVLTVATKVGF